MVLKKSGWAFVALSLFFIIALSFSVSAAVDLKPTLESIKTISDDLNLAKNLSVIMLGLLLWIITYTITKKLFSLESKWPALGVSLIIVILAFIYLPENFVEAIVLQYGVYGATILSVIPFALLLYFTVSVSTNIFFSRVVWIFYIIYYIAIYLYKIFSGDKFLSINNLPYFGALIAGLIVLFALPTIRNWAFKGELSAEEEQGMRDIHLRKLGRKLERKDTEARLEGIDGEGI